MWGIAMSNKIVLLFLIGGLSCTLSAQTYRYNRRNRTRTGTQNVSVQQSAPAEKKQEPESKAKNTPAKNAPATAEAARRFDPTKPVLTQEDVKKILNENIRKKVLERKIPDQLKECTIEQFFSQSECSKMLSEYQQLMKNFELTEVTRIQPEWYKKYYEELEKFKPVAFEMYVAMRKLSNSRFAAAVRAFEKQQEACLNFLKEKPPRISSEQLTDLRKRNTRIRQQNYLKRLQEKRQAEIKRRQELLKQKNQKK